MELYWRPRTKNYFRKFFHSNYLIIQFSKHLTRKLSSVKLFVSTFYNLQNGRTIEFSGHLAIAGLFVNQIFWYLWLPNFSTSLCIRTIVPFSALHCLLQLKISSKPYIYNVDCTTLRTNLVTYNHNYLISLHCTAWMLSYILTYSISLSLTLPMQPPTWQGHSLLQFYHIKSLKLFSSF